MPSQQTMRVIADNFREAPITEQYKIILNTYNCIKDKRESMNAAGKSYVDNLAKILSDRKIIAATTNV